MVEVAERRERSLAKNGSSENIYSHRARYFDSETAFNMSLPPVPANSFISERDQALDPETGTKFLPLDQGDAMKLPFPATTPLVLAA